MSEPTRRAAILSYRLDARRRLEAEGGRANTIPIVWEYRLPPNYPLSDRDAERLAHRDLEGMSRDELTTEAWRLRLTLAFGDLRRPGWAKEWLTERLQRCKALLKEAKQ